MTAIEHHDESIRDSFISGLRSPYIRQRLLENDTPTLEVAFTSARALEVAQKNSETYTTDSSSGATICQRYLEPLMGSYNRPPPMPDPAESTTAAARYYRNDNQNDSKCYFCGLPKHPRFKCKAKDEFCSKCGKKGHYARMCRSNPTLPGKTAAALYSPPQPPGQTPDSTPEAHDSWPPGPLWAISKIPEPLCSTSPEKFPPHPLTRSMINIEVNHQPIVGVADTASSNSFVRPDCAQKLNLTPIMMPSEDRFNVSMASKSLTVEVSSYSKVNLKVKDRTYEEYKIYILPNLCAKILLGLDFLTRHESITLKYGGNEPPLTIC